MEMVDGDGGLEREGFGILFCIFRTAGGGRRIVRWMNRWMDGSMDGRIDGEILMWTWMKFDTVISLGCLLPEFLHAQY